MKIATCVPGFAGWMWGDQPTKYVLVRKPKSDRLGCRAFEETVPESYQLMGDILLAWPATYFFHPRKGLCHVLVALSIAQEPTLERFIEGMRKEWWCPVDLCFEGSMKWRSLDDRTEASLTWIPREHRKNYPHLDASLLLKHRETYEQLVNEFRERRD